MSSQSEPALPVSKQDGHNIKSGAIDCQIHVAILVEIAGHEQLRRDDAAGSMVSQSRRQKCRGKDEASQRCEWYLFHNFTLFLVKLPLVDLDLTNLEMRFNISTYDDILVFKRNPDHDLGSARASEIR